MINHSLTSNFKLPIISTRNKLKYSLSRHMTNLFMVLFEVAPDIFFISMIITFDEGTEWITRYLQTLTLMFRKVIWSKLTIASRAFELFMLSWHGCLSLRIDYKPNPNPNQSHVRPYIYYKDL
jgi:hypothetical protein